MRHTLPISVQEIQTFWQRYAQRHQIDSSIIRIGNEVIKADPEYWADQEMTVLYDRVRSAYLAGRIS